MKYNLILQEVTVTVNDIRKLTSWHLYNIEELINSDSNVFLVVADPNTYHINGHMMENKDYPKCGTLTELWQVLLELNVRAWLSRTSNSYFNDIVYRQSFCVYTADGKSDHGASFSYRHY